MTSSRDMPVVVLAFQFLEWAGTMFVSGRQGNKLRRLGNKPLSEIYTNSSVETVLTTYHELRTDRFEGTGKTSLPLIRRQWETHHRSSCNPPTECLSCPMMAIYRFRNPILLHQAHKLEDEDRVSTEVPECTIWGKLLFANASNWSSDVESGYYSNPFSNISHRPIQRMKSDRLQPLDPLDYWAMFRSGTRIAGNLFGGIDAEKCGRSSGKPSILAGFNNAP